jgi:hypothetical protein
MSSKQDNEGLGSWKVSRLEASRLESWVLQKEKRLDSIKPWVDEKGMKASMKKVGSGREGGQRKREFEVEAR